MPTDALGIQDHLDAIIIAAKTLQKGGHGSEKARKELNLAAEKLAIAVREPEENVHFVETQVKR